MVLLGWAFPGGWIRSEMFSYWHCYLWGMITLLIEGWSMHNVFGLCCRNWLAHAAHFCDDLDLYHVDSDMQAHVYLLGISESVTMPRKVNYGVDYEEDFYDYDDYNYDYDDGYEYSETNGECPSSLPSASYLKMYSVQSPSLHTHTHIKKIKNKNANKQAERNVNHILRLPLHDKFEVLFSIVIFYLDLF